MESAFLSRYARIAAALALIAVAVQTVAAPGRASADPTIRSGGLIAEDVSYRNGDVTISGTVIAPAAEGTGRPGIVLVPGAGEGIPREFYRPHAEAFARAGIVALIYDKRTAAEGYSLFEASITDLADDAIAGVRLLRDRPDVDPDMVGVHGHSEGGWTVLVAGNRSSDVGFVVASAPSALPPERTQLWMNGTQLRHAGVTESLVRPLGENLTRHVVGAGMFRLAGQDPIPPLERLDQPLLGLFAEHDRNAPPNESLRLFRDALDRGGNTHYTLRVIEGADHLMVRSRNGFDVDVSGLARGDLDVLADFAPGYVDTVTRWVLGLADQPAAASADAPPPQDHTSAPLTPLASYESLWVQAAACVVLVLAFVSYPLTAAVRRLRGRRDPVPSRWPARVLVLAGLVVPPLTVSYLGYIMTTAARALGPVVAGRPLPWLLLQLGALTAVTAALVLTARWWRERRHHTPSTNTRFGVLLAGATVFVPWAAYWGLFTL